MFSIIGITGRVGGGAASRLLGVGKQVCVVDGRGGEMRTPDPLLPKQVTSFVEIC
jgi:hypothetical protein